MGVNLLATREEVYNAPVFNWESACYTPVPNSSIMNLIERNINESSMHIRNSEFRVSRSADHAIRGVIGSYNIETEDGSFGQKIMFRNSYDKSMSFAIVQGLHVWICSNGCISGDYQYKRVHRGTEDGNTTTTMRDVVNAIGHSFQNLQLSFNRNKEQLNNMKDIRVKMDLVEHIVGELFLVKEVLTVTQMSIVKKELYDSRNFKHCNDDNFTAYDLYNHITEALKFSHPINYVKDHIVTHKLFEETFNV